MTDMTEMQNAQNYACLMGDVRTFRSASHAAGAIIEVLKDDEASGSRYRRTGLLEALAMIAFELDQRAVFIQGEVLGEDIE